MDVKNSVVSRAGVGGELRAEQQHRRLRVSVPGSDTTTFTLWSRATSDSRTQRCFRTRREQPCRVDGCVDFFEVLPDQKGATCAGFLSRAVAFFIASEIPRIEQVMTDNVWAYRHSLKAVVAELGATQTFIKPHCPW